MSRGDICRFLAIILLMREERAATFAGMLFVHFGRLRSGLAVFLGALVFAGAVRGTTVVPPEFTELVNGSDYIVHAVVKSVTAEKRPRGNGVKIVTLVELDVIEVVAGTPPEKVTLELLGGKVGEEELRVVGMPEFKVGDEDILFVSRNGRAVAPLYAMGHGRYAVTREAESGRKRVMRADGAPLQDTAQVSLPLAKGGTGELARRRMALSSALEPAEFIQRIRAERKAGIESKTAK